MFNIFTVFSHWFNSGNVYSFIIPDSPLQRNSWNSSMFYLLSDRKYSFCTGIYKSKGNVVDMHSLWRLEFYVFYMKYKYRYIAITGFPLHPAVEGECAMGDLPVPRSYVFHGVEYRDYRSIETQHRATLYQCTFHRSVSWYRL